MFSPFSKVLAKCIWFSIRQLIETHTVHKRDIYEMQLIKNCTLVKGFHLVLTCLNSTLFMLRLYILTDFNYATLTSPYIFQRTVECKLPLLRKCHHELASSANTFVLTVQLNWTVLFAPYEFSHLNIS